MVTKKEDDLTKKVEELNNIYQEYLVKLDKLAKKQHSLIKEFVKIIEDKKIQEIRDKINN